MEIRSRPAEARRAKAGITGLTITFVIAITLIAIVAALAFILTGEIREVGYRANERKAFYLAEAGRERAVWDLRTPITQGGKGVSWRTTGTTESFGSGSYTIQVGDTEAAEILITSEGNYQGIKKTVQVRYQRYSEAFDYAIFSIQNISLKNNATVSGNVLVDGDVVISNNAEVKDGAVITTEGHTVSGNGIWTLGTPPDPLPTFPTIDTSFYNNEIAKALASEVENYSYQGTLNLAGGTIYAKGDIVIEGTIIGPGSLVAGDDIFITNNSAIGSNINLISQDNLEISNNASIEGNNILYANTRVKIENNVVGERTTIISTREVLINNNAALSGMIFAGQLTLKNNINFTGSIQTGGLISDNLIGNNTTITYDRRYLPEIPPPGLDVGISFVKGSWKEL